MDNFNLALRAKGSAEQLKSGVEMIVKQMDDALRGLNVQPVETVGAQFDPRVHEALGSIETKEFPDHQVMEEIRRGYKLREKLLRPALVRIASNADQVSDRRAAWVSGISPTLSAMEVPGILFRMHGASQITEILRYDAE